MRVLVTGSSGFIGTRVCRLLSQSGHDVTGFDHRPPAGDLNAVVGDILDAQALASVMPGIEAVVHLAAAVSVVECEAHPARARAVNVDGAVAVTQAALDSGVTRALFASSAAVYGPRSGTVSEQEPCAPASVYGSTKLEAEIQLRAMSAGTPGVLRIVRPFNVYGRGQAYRGAASPLVAAIGRAIFTGEPLVIRGDGSQRRDFVHVEDVARVIVDYVLEDAPRFSPVNIGTGVPRSVNDVVSIAEAVTGMTVARRHVRRAENDIEESVADVQLLRSVDPDYRPIGLEDGLAEALSAAPISSSD